MAGRKRALTGDAQQAAEQDERDEHFLPPRKMVHKAEKERWVKWFYRTLLALFFALVVGLLIWGAKFALK
ncbi:hypothetical protein [Paenibacillus thalictri]|uniref:Uncharacterized protein n=1 Tax=Paenibacillus thalictri TaxID=2527873 RepID=A0A4Q9DSD9_9BACL|nr:hypothetical protein [Paenibacillus thalictri]TBL79779.1 hypothetical protein EYB31_09245 [Paenibacillus thalictri]